MREISLLELLKSGAHFGHTTSRWNPKMKPYIFTVRNNIHILYLEKTKSMLQKAANFAKDTASKGGIILFVGTKKQSKEILKKLSAHFDQCQLGSMKVYLNIGNNKLETPYCIKEIDDIERDLKNIVPEGKIEII